MKQAKEAEKTAKQAARAAEKAAKQADTTKGKGKQTRAGSKRKAQERGEGSTNTKKARSAIDGDGAVFTDDVCCACLGSYEDDAGTDREWLQCKCSKWIHEDCVDYSDSNPDGSLCPLC